MPDEQLRIAVFIDFDNVDIGVRSTLSKDFEVAAVLEALKERGEVISKIAYGNWRRHGNATRMMSEQAVQMVQRDPTPRGDKNGADINLALDALEMAFTKPHINAYAIVGGDSDFIALVEKLKQYNKAVFVVGGRGFTSTILQKNCREFLSYENLVRQAETPAHPPAARPRASRRGEAQPVENALPLLERALKVLAEREHQPLLGLVKSTMLQLDSTFSERDYGSNSFLDFIQKMSHAGFVQVDRVDSNYTVKLPERAHAAATASPAPPPAPVSPRSLPRREEPPAPAAAEPLPHPAPSSAPPQAQAVVKPEVAAKPSRRRRPTRTSPTLFGELRAVNAENKEAEAAAETADPAPQPETPPPARPRRRRPAAPRKKNH